MAKLNYVPSNTLIRVIKSGKEFVYVVFIKGNTDVIHLLVAETEDVPLCKIKAAVSADNAVRIVYEAGEFRLFYQSTGMEVSGSLTDNVRKILSDRDKDYSVRALVDFLSAEVMTRIYYLSICHELAKKCPDFDWKALPESVAKEIFYSKDRKAIILSLAKESKILAPTEDLESKIKELEEAEIALKAENDNLRIERADLSLEKGELLDEQKILKNLISTDLIEDTKTLIPVRLEQFLKDRPYKIPKGYIAWDRLAPCLALIIESYVNETLQPRDDASILNAARTALWYEKDAPVYLLTKDLYYDFSNSYVLDKKNLLKDIKIAISTLLLIFPENLVKDPLGNNINYIIIHLSDKDNPNESSGKFRDLDLPLYTQNNKLNFHWSTVAFPEDFCWFSGTSITEDGELIDGDKQIGLDKINPKEYKFLKDITNIALQVILSLEYRKDLIEPENNNDIPRNKYDKSPEYRKPRILGSTYRILTESKGGTHQSPISHWRIGHWRRVAVGKREENNRDWRWIQPVYVKKNKD